MYIIDRKIAQGFGIIYKKTYHKMVSHFLSMALGSSIPLNVDINLTERELEIIRHIANGKHNQEIAQLLYIGVGRVKNIITGLLKKLQVKDRAQLMVFAIKNNLV